MTLAVKVALNPNTTNQQMLTWISTKLGWNVCDYKILDSCTMDLIRTEHLELSALEIEKLLLLT